MTISPPIRVSSTFVDKTIFLTPVASDIADSTLLCCALSNSKDEVTSAWTSPLILETSDKKTSIISCIKNKRPLLAKVPQNLMVKLSAFAFFKILTIEDSLLALVTAGDLIIFWNKSLLFSIPFNDSKSLTILDIIFFSVANSCKALAYLPDNPDDPLILIFPYI